MCCMTWVARPAPCQPGDNGPRSQGGRAVSSHLPSSEGARIMETTKPVGVSSVSSLITVTGRRLTWTKLPQLSPASGRQCVSSEGVSLRRRKRRIRPAPIISTSRSPRTMNTFRLRTLHMCHFLVLCCLPTSLKKNWEWHFNKGVVERIHEILVE